MSNGEIVQRHSWPARIEARSATALRAEIGRAFQAGELAAVGPIHRVPDGYAVDVLRLKDRSVVPSWRKPALIGGAVVLVLGGAGALGWWLLSATMTLAAGLSLPIVATVAALGWLGSRALSGGSGCETTVTIRHRH